MACMLCCFDQKTEDNVGSAAAEQVPAASSQRQISGDKLVQVKAESERFMLEKNYYDAIAKLEERLKLEREIHGKSTQHEDIAVTLGHLGEMYFRLENYGKAQLFLIESLDMWKRLHPDYTEYVDERLASMLTILGNVWEKQKDFEKAVKYHEEALKMKKAIEAGVATNDGRAPYLSTPGPAGSSS
ncbi:nephrocystin-3-like [Ptychodera flava]|uniref:nephrocystin-3-like n=1 Tax=Ptychodera flava TaxID=63121 RepID=UPI00396A0308